MSNYLWSYISLPSSSFFFSFIHWLNHPRVKASTSIALSKEDIFKGIIYEVWLTHHNHILLLYALHFDDDKTNKLDERVHLILLHLKWNNFLLILLYFSISCFPLKLNNSHVTNCTDNHYKCAFKLCVYDNH